MTADDGFLTKTDRAVAGGIVGDPGDGAPLDSITPANGADERFRIGREMARGGMGVIHVAEDRRLSRVVAVKRLVGRDVGAKARFEREAFITANLQHPAVVPVFDYGDVPATGPYYAMKLVDGISLGAAIAKAATVEDRLSLLPHVVTVVEATAYAHNRGIVHRDLKPSNVLVGAFGETVVIDWGLAKHLGTVDVPRADGDPIIDGNQLTRAGTVMGTPAYMSPEQAAGEEVDARADVYALGAMLYHLLAGHSPYPSTTARQVLDQVRSNPPIPLRRVESALPIDLVTIVEKAMARSPELRYPSAREMSLDLRRFQTGQLVGAHRYTAWQLMRRLVSKNPFAAALGALVIVSIVFAIALVVVRQARLRDALETKRLADIEIARLEIAIEAAHDPAELRALVTNLEDVTQRARRVSESLGAAAPVALGNDPLDLRIHGVLARLDADTYSIPPRFRRRVISDIDGAKQSVALAGLADRKRKLWPVIAQELEAVGLPEELGYLASVESFLSPATRSPNGFAGLWQFPHARAREYGLIVDDVVDERLDPVKSSRAAAQLLAELFAEFGGDAALIAVVSYNLGEGKTRQLLRDIAKEQGSWRRGQRSYWHLYRMRRFPPEADEYVSRLVAAALDFSRP